MIRTLASKNSIGGVTSMYPNTSVMITAENGVRKLVATRQNMCMVSNKMPSTRCGCMQYRNLSSEASISGDVLSRSLKNSVGTTETQSLNIVEYMEIVQQKGNGAVLFSDAPPVLWAVDALCTFRELPGMTWISTIICGTLLLRSVIAVPVAIAQNKAISRLEHLKPDLKKLSEDLKLETAFAIKEFKWDEKTARRQYTKSYKKHWKTMVESNNCHPMKSLALSLTQLPFWICFSSALRNIVYAVPLPRTPDKIERWIQIHNEGTPWVTSLVIADPIVFPAIFLVANMLNIEFNRRQRLGALPETKLQKIFPWVIRGGIMAIAFIATSVPSAVSMYWAASSSLALVQNIVLASPSVKKFFRVPTKN